MHDTRHREVRTAAELRDIVGHPAEYVANKVGDRLTPIQQDWAIRPASSTSSTTPRSRSLSAPATSASTAI